MARPSDPLLQWLREMLEKKGVNTAAAANAAGIKRSRARRILSGSEPMTVDELLQISNGLELSPADMGMPIDLADLPEEEEENDDDPHPDDFVPLVNPWINNQRQLVQVAFALGCDFGFLVKTEELDESGVPRAVLDAHEGGPMMIQLDAAYHKYNNPRYDGKYLTLTLSFDDIRDCFFPWDAITRVSITPAPLSDIEEDEPVVPTLRLVT